MTTYYEIPVSSRSSRFAVTLNGIKYNMALTWRQNDQAGWILDISDINNTPLVYGIPLTTGLNLLMQYPYLGIGTLVVLSDGELFVPPTFDTLGTSCHLLFVTEP